MASGVRRDGNRFVASVQQAAQGAEFATKRDVDELRAELKAEIREAELRLEARIKAIRSDIQAIKADILSRAFGPIRGALIVNIVAVIGVDPIAAGYATSLARPRGNLTGIVMLAPEPDGKRVGILHEAVPPQSAAGRVRSCRDGESRRSGRH